MELHKREFRSCNGQSPVQGPERLAGESSRREHMNVDPTQTSIMQPVGSDESPRPPSCSASRRRRRHRTGQNAWPSAEAWNRVGSSSRTTRQDKRRLSARGHEHPAFDL